MFGRRAGFRWVVRGRSRLAQRACGGSQGRLRAARAAAGPALRATLLNPCRGRRRGYNTSHLLPRDLGNYMANKNQFASLSSFEIKVDTFVEVSIQVVEIKFLFLL